MPETTCYVPIRVRVRGDLGDAQLEQLEQAIRRTVTARLGLAGRTLSQAGHGPGSAADIVREEYRTERHEVTAARYAVPSYDGPRPVAVPLRRGADVQQTTLARIHSLLSTGLFDSVSEEEARTVLSLLRGLEGEELLRVVMAMRLSGDWNTFRRSLANVDLGGLTELEIMLDPNAGVLMPGDDVRIEVYAGGELQRDMSLEYNVLREGVQPLPLRDPIPVTGLTPEAAATAIARAYVDAMLLVEPQVRLLVTRRGSLYAPRSGPTAQSLWFESQLVPDRSSPEGRRRARRAVFAAYARAIQVTDGRTASAVHHYLRWVDEQERTREFHTREPSDLWSWALARAHEAAPTTPRQRFVELAQSMSSRIGTAPAGERPRLQAALQRYLAWLDLHWDEAQLERYDPVDVWVRAYRQALQTELRADEERLLREARARAASPPIDWPAVERKLDEAITLVSTHIWRMPDPYTVESRRERIGYLVAGSQLEREVRDLIATAFLDDVMARLAEPGFTETSAAADLAAWLRSHPEHRQALLLAQSYPSAEQYEVEIDIPAWQTAVEVGIGFIPIVGQVVGVAELLSGTDLFGNPLSTTDRAILAAGILLPGAARVVRLGRAAVAVPRLARMYNMSSREADVLFRAMSGIPPGSAGAQVLRSAVDDVRAGRGVRDPERLRQVEGVLREMGMTERATAEVVRHRTGQAVAGTGEELAESAGRGGGGTGDPGIPGSLRPPTGGRGGGVPRGVQIVEIGAGDLGASLRLARQGAVVTAVDVRRPAGELVQELESLGGRFIEGTVRDVPAGSADQVFQYFPWRIEGTGAYAAAGGTWEMMDQALRVVRPGGVVTFVTESRETAEFLLGQAARFGNVRRSALVQSTARQAAPGASGFQVPGMGPELPVWHLNVYVE